MGWWRNRRLARSLLSRPPQHPSRSFFPKTLDYSTYPTHPRNLPSATSVKLGPPPLHDAKSTSLCKSIGVVAAANGADMEKELDKLRPDLSCALAIDVVRALTDRGTSALRFFNWFSTSPRGLPHELELYNLVVNNLFLVEDHDAVSDILGKIQSFGFFLTERAFGFLKLRSSSDAGGRDSVLKVVEILRRVRGSCFRSGISALVRVLCESGSPDLAVLAIDGMSSSRRALYCNALIAAKCRSGDFHGAKALLDEMRRSNRNLWATSYNYLLGSLFKNGRVEEGCGLLQTMEESGCMPDEVTYEVVVFRACRIGSVDVALEFLDKMLDEGLRPRLTTHAAIIKCFSRLGRVGDARKYVIDMCARDSCSSNVNYSLLANLLRMAGRVVEGASVLDEMMEKGLRPNFPVYVRTVKDLQRIGREDVASNLKCRFSMFPSPRNAR